MSDGGLQLEGVDVRFGTAAGLRGLTLQVAAGERVALLGPSGAGKTSLLRVIAGLDPLAGGRVIVGGIDVSSVTPDRRRTVYLHQNPSLFTHLSVVDNVAFPLEVRGVERRQARRQATELLARVHLDGFALRRAGGLSGGQRHRVALARALAAQPHVLLLDEPFSALDPSLRAEVREAVMALLDDRGPATIVVTHDIDEAAQFADRLAVLLDRRITQFAPPGEVLCHPASLRVARFLGIPNIIAGASDGTGRFESPIGSVPAGSHAGPGLLVGRADAFLATRAPAGRGIARVEAFVERVGGTWLWVRAGAARVLASEAGDARLAVGDSVEITIFPDRVHVLPPESDSVTEDVPRVR
ncbi:MAG: ABC transporter ATP-binding protein [Gemmatimonadaceae bacterium]